jgi:excisionase family DNA binding protein
MSTPKFMTKPPPPTPILVDCREASRLLSISPRKLWELTKLGEIPSLKIGKSVRYRIVDLEAWTRQQVNVMAAGAGNAKEI